MIESYVSFYVKIKRIIKYPQSFPGIVTPSDCMIVIVVSTFVCHSPGGNKVIGLVRVVIAYELDSFFVSPFLCGLFSCGVAMLFLLHCIILGNVHVYNQILRCI